MQIPYRRTDAPLNLLVDGTGIKFLGIRLRTRAFSEFLSPSLFDDKFGRPGKGNDEGNVEGVIGFGRA